jgi:hypothetical protein
VRSQFIGDRPFKCTDGSGGIVVVERHDQMDDRQVTEPDGCVLGKFGLQMVGQGLGPLGITRESGGYGGAVFEFASAKAVAAACFASRALPKKASQRADLAKRWR